MGNCNLLFFIFWWLGHSHGCQDPRFDSITQICHRMINPTASHVCGSGFCLLNSSQSIKFIKYELWVICRNMSSINKTIKLVSLNFISLITRFMTWKKDVMTHEGTESHWAQFEKFDIKCLWTPAHQIYFLLPKNSYGWCRDNLATDTFDNSLGHIFVRNVLHLSSSGQCLETVPCAKIKSYDVNVFLRSSCLFFLLSVRAPLLYFVSQLMIKHVLTHV